MFDIGGTELLVIAIVAIVVVGPKELPRMLRTLGQFVGKAKSMAREFQTHFNEAVDEAGLDEVRKGIDSVQRATTKSDFGDTFKPLTDAGNDIKREIEKPAASASDKSATTEPATTVATAVTDKAKAEPDKKADPENKTDAAPTGGGATSATS
jgi:sec-independent protein translocase protein TatB